MHLHTITVMNKNVIEIISQLIKKLLNDDFAIENEKELINYLVNEGYNLNDINQAFDIIFSSTDIDAAIEKKELFEKIKNNNFKQRIFDFREKFYFNLRVQGIIIKLNALGLIKDRELEIIIVKSLARKEKISPGVFWDLLQDVIDDKFRLVNISKQIDEFEMIDAKGDKYLN